MKNFQTEGGYIIVLSKGEKIIESILGFCKQQQIKSAWLSGLGAVLKAELGYYQLDKQNYHFVKLDSILEIVSLGGNITIFDSQPLAHIHVVLSDESMKTYGGHLKEAIAGGTCELYLQVLGTKLKRKIDEDTGLKLII